MRPSVLERQKTRQGQWLGELPPSAGKGLRAGQGVSISFGIAEKGAGRGRVHPSVLERQKTRQGQLPPSAGKGLRAGQGVSVSFGIQKTRQGQWLGQLPPSAGRGLMAGQTKRQGASVSFGEKRAR